MPGLTDTDMESKNFESFSAGAKFKEYGHGKDSESAGGGGGGSKKKRSFLQKAKKFGKQGKLGRGHHVDEETYQYFVRVLELFRKNEFDTDEERELFIGNSLSQAAGSEVDLSSNQLISRVIENILPLANEESVDQFCQAFTPSLRVIVSDPFASHVLEKLLEIRSSDKWLESSVLTTWFENTSRYILNNFEDFTFDKHGSFVMKKVLECLSGFVERPAPAAGPHGQVVTKKKNKVDEGLYGERKRNPERETMLKDFAKRFSAWPQFNDLIHKDVTSRLIQNVIQTVHHTKGSEKLVKEIIMRVVNAVGAPFEATDPVNRIMEVCLEAADSDTYTLIYEKYYKGSLPNYVVGPSFTLQKIISSAPTDECFADIFDELVPIFDTLVQEGKSSIIYKLGQQCFKLKSKQKEFWQLLKEKVSSMNFYSEEESGSESNLIVKLLSLGRDEQNPTGKNKDQFCTYFGAHMVEVLLDFDKPSTILKSVNELETKQLVRIALDFKGSYVLSKLFTSSNVPQKQKIKLLATLSDNLVELATSKSGSRVIDDIWAWAELPQKATVADKLSQRIPLLSSNKFGHFLVSKCGLHAFQKDRKEWSEHMASLSKKKKAALDIAEELGLTTMLPDISKKSKKRKSEDDFEAVETTPEETKSKGKKHRKSLNEVDKTLNDSQNDVEEDEEQAKTPKNKKHKRRKHEDLDQEMTEESNQAETPKKKKQRKSERAENTELKIEPENIETESKTSKKKRHRKSEQPENINVKIETEEVEAESQTPKKKKHRKSEHAENAAVKIEPEEIDTDIVTPKKKNRKSKQPENTGDILEPEENEETESKSSKKKKSRKSAHIDTDIKLKVDNEDLEGEIETPKKKKSKKSKEVNGDDFEAEPIQHEQSYESETPKKKKHRKSKHAENNDNIIDQSVESEQAETPKRKKPKTPK